MTSHVTSTPTPPGIEVANEVRTRLGRLRFFDGFRADDPPPTRFVNVSHEPMCDIEPVR
jgi:hypothetical protein